MATIDESPVTLAVPPGSKFVAETRDEDGRIYLLLGLSPEMNERIEELAHRGGETKANLINKAVALYKLATDAVDDGKRVLIVDDRDDEETEIVGLSR